MSLKAKIEAVIYASEEPVTLAQLVGLLGHEAQAELDHLDSAQRTLALDAAQDAAEAAPEDNALDPDALNSEVLTPPEYLEDSESGELAEELAAAQETREAEAVLSEVPGIAVEPEQGSSEPAVAIQVEVAAAEPVYAQEQEKDEKATAREEKARTQRLREYFRSLLDALVADYAIGDRGLEIREVAGGYRLATKPEYHDAVRGFVKSLKPPLKLSLQALETLAVVAYKQPVTAPEISEIRGVDSGGVLGSLLARKLVTTAGRKQVIGRPILYKTTKDFLLRFGLKDINELPSIEEFEKMAGELAEQEEIPMEHTAPHEGNDLENVDEEQSVEGEAVADEALVDGRISGLPPNYDTDEVVDGEDSPALDAEIQQDAGEDHD